GDRPGQAGAPARPAAGRGGVRLRPPGRPGPAARPRGRHGPPRRQAGQPAADARRRGQGARPGQRFLSGTVTDGVWLWAADDPGKPARRVTDALAYDTMPLSADGRRAVFGQFNGSLLVWNVEAWEGVRKLQGDPGELRTIALSADGRRA